MGVWALVPCEGARAVSQLAACVEHAANWRASNKKVIDIATQRSRTVSPVDGSVTATCLKNASPVRAALLASGQCVRIKPNGLEIVRFVMVFIFGRFAVAG